MYRNINRRSSRGRSNRRKVDVVVCDVASATEFAAKVVIGTKFSLGCSISDTFRQTIARMIVLNVGRGLYFDVRFFILAASLADKLGVAGNSYLSHSRSR